MYPKSIVLLFQNYKCERHIQKLKMRKQIPKIKIQESTDVSTFKANIPCFEE
jgi:hypothetical protein